MLERDPAAVALPRADVAEAALPVLSVLYGPPSVTWPYTRPRPSGKGAAEGWGAPPTHTLTCVKGSAT